MSRFKQLPKRTLNALPKSNNKELPKYGAEQGYKRVTGTTLQNRRLRLWEANPHCRKCGRVIAYPRGFELDHIIPLGDGGSDLPDNWQLLCVWWEGVIKMGCHADKTNKENRER